MRRLAAILSADVVGYSSLMNKDEAGTLAVLRAHRAEVFDPAVTARGGRIVKLMGDGVLVEFPSVVEAVECAVAVQKSLAREGGPIQLRIGINLGDVIVEDGDIYGDGVNIAARLEALAEPGGIVVSAAAYDQAKGKVSVDFEDGGTQPVKNISEPVRVFRVRPGGAAAPSVKSGLRPVHAVLAVVLVAIAGAVVWWQTWSVPPASAPAPSSVAGIAEKPSIVVLPFANLSASPDQSYFADGMTESLITDLSRVSGLLVIARNTSFTFKDQAIDVQDVSRELGVRYVIEGSVQRSGDRVRINANLIDASSGYQIWAEKLDRNASDLFALQDEVIGQIIGALEVRLTEDERRAVAQTYTDSLEAYDLYLRAWEQYWESSEESRREARRLLTLALEQDPNFTRALTLLAMTYTTQLGVAIGGAGNELDQAYELAQRAVESDAGIPQVHWVLALVHMFRREYDEARASIARSIELDPNFADAYGLLAWILQYSGDPEQALEVMKIANRLNPRGPYPYLSAEAEANFALANYDRTIAVMTQALERNPSGQRLRLFMAAALVLAGDIEEAEWQVEELLLLDPGLNLAAAREIAPYRDPAVTERFIDALRRAGLPE